MNNRIVEKLLLGVLALAALTPLGHAQAQLAGDWKGEIYAGGSQFRIVWHVVAAKDGSLTSTIDNVDQGMIGIAVKSTTVKDSKVTLNIDTVAEVNGQSINLSGTYEGTLTKDSNEVDGTWTQTAPNQDSLELDMKHVPAAPAPAAAAPVQIAGDWVGVLDTGGPQLHLVLHITQASDGSLSSNLDSVDQGAMAIPVATTTLKDGKLTLAVDVVHGAYEGAVNKDATEIAGTWTQGQPLQLSFKRAPAVAAAPPPAAPAKP
jgi:hypothetical protein